MPAIEPLISVYPNPANDLANIHSDLAFNKITLLDLSGQIVKEIAANETDLSIETRDLGQGIYFVKLSFNNGRTVSRKIVVMKN